jgi:hypothetical protein
MAEEANQQLTIQPSAAPVAISELPAPRTPGLTRDLPAEQTEDQPMQGFVPNIHASADAPDGPVAIPSERLSGAVHYSLAQYTPSAPEAATGAYSAPRRQAAPVETAPAQTQLAPTQEANPAAATHRKKHREARHFEAASQLSSPILATAPAAQLPQPELPQQELLTQEQQPATTPAAPATTGAGLSDEELQQRSLPPLRGPWVRVQREQRTPSPRDEAEMQLRSIESGYSPWLGGAGLLNYRSGDLGFDHLSALEAPFEVSMPLGYNARLTFVAKPVFLDSGQATGSSVVTLSAAPPTAGVPLVSITIPQPLGTSMNTLSNPPAQQSAVGVGGEVQLAFPHLALAGGYTPAGFLVATVTARAQWKPNDGPFTFNFVREPVRDTQLSYAGLRDPAGNTLGNQGQIWGGVVANQGAVRYARGDAQSGFYLGAGGQYLGGYKVETNNRFDGSGGAYWRLKTIPEYGNLNVGVNFFAMHYANNEDAFTYGMGGYFSPQAYFLANVPFTWVGHSGTHWHYNILGSLGVQAFQENATPLFPTSISSDENTISATSGSVTYSNLTLPAKTSVGPNYDLRSQVAYQIGPHWFAGGFFGANNSRNYSAVSTGFYVRYLFREQPSTVTTPTGIFPVEGLRPFSAP